MLQATALRILENKCLRYFCFRFILKIDLNIFFFQFSQFCTNLDKKYVELYFNECKCLKCVVDMF